VHPPATFSKVDGSAKHGSRSRTHPKHGITKKS
jgi:hypothetical protein